MHGASPIGGHELCRRPNHSPHIQYFEQETHNLVAKTTTPSVRILPKLAYEIKHSNSTEASPWPHQYVHHHTCCLRECSSNAEVAPRAPEVEAPAQDDLTLDAGRCLCGHVVVGIRCTVSGLPCLSATIYSSVAGNFLLHTVEMETPKFRVGTWGLRIGKA